MIYFHRVLGVSPVDCMMDVVLARVFVSSSPGFGYICGGCDGRGEGRPGLGRQEKGI